ncbi:MAG: SulP family inorganic anion transporter [Chloroflexota bacterium]|nr:SulP family inorganic anion transporter [Chloroflexota bacterium]
MSTLVALLASVRRGIEGPEGPSLAWTLRGYRPEQLLGDVISGLTVAALIVPLSIGYAGVAGLPPEIGLYASLAPLVAYAIFGSARTLIVGPDASTAALLAATIAPLAAASDERVRLASMLGLLVAAVFVGMRLARMGFLADFLSRPILVGYMTGVGITVALGQVEKIAGGPAVSDAIAVLGGIDWTSADAGAVVQAMGIAVQGSGADLASFLLGGGVAAAMLIGRRLVPQVPMALVAMIVALILSALLDLQSRGVQVLGPVPSGLPSLGIPTASLAELVALVPGALGLALLSFADTTATGRSFASKRGDRTESNRELVALAAADAAGAVSGGYPVSSSPSRTAAAEGSGSSSQMTGIVAALATAIVLILLTAPLSYLPIPALGGVIMVSVLGLIDVPTMRRFAQVRASEGMIAFIAMVGVILYGTLVGVGIAVLLAALNIVRRAAAPYIAEEGRTDDGTWRDVVRRTDGRRVEGVVVVRFSGPLFFANVASLEARVREVVAARPEIHAVILDLGATADIDLTAGGAIRELSRELERDGRQLAVARPLGKVRDQLRAYGLDGLMGATAGTYGNVDEVITGLGLDPAAVIVDATLGGVVPDAGTSPADAETAIRNRVVVRVLAVGLAAVVGAIAIAVVLSPWAGGPAAGPTAVPNLLGLPLDRATIAAQDSGFELSVPVYVRNDDWPERTVVGQDPPAGTIADPGSEIQPLVSTGRQLVNVPDVVGSTEAQAIATLTGAGLTVRRIEAIYDQDIAAGAVISTVPVAGASVATGTAVAYTVSRGPQPVPTAGPTPSPRPSAAPTPSTAPSPTLSAQPSASAVPPTSPSLPPEPSPTVAPSAP